MSPCNAPGGRASPRGDALPGSPGGGGQGRARATVPAGAPSGRRLRLSALPGAEKGKERRGEAATSGRRRPPGNFAVKGRLGKGAALPSHPLPATSLWRRAGFALGIGRRAQRPPSLQARSSRADAGGPGLGRAPRPERKSRWPWRQLRGVSARTRLPSPRMAQHVLACTWGPARPRRSLR